MCHCMVLYVCMCIWLYTIKINCACISHALIMSLLPSIPRTSLKEFFSLKSRPRIALPSISPPPPPHYSCVRSHAIPNRKRQGGFNTKSSIFCFPPYNDIDNKSPSALFASLFYIYGIIYLSCMEQRMHVYIQGKNNVYGLQAFYLSKHSVT